MAFEANTPTAEVVKEANRMGPVLYFFTFSPRFRGFEVSRFEVSRFRGFGDGASECQNVHKSQY